MSLVGDETSVTRAITGAVLSIVKELTDNDELTLPAESVTLIVQSL